MASNYGAVLCKPNIAVIQRCQSKILRATVDAPQYVTNYTGLFISPSGISELDCPTTKTDTAERSISIGRESLQVFFFY